MRIIEKVISDVEQHSVEPSYRTFFINIDELNKLLGDLGSAHPNAYVSLNLDALPSAPGVSYNTDLIKYVGLTSSFSGKSFVKKNTSTLVEIRLQLSVDTSVYDFPTPIESNFRKLSQFSLRFWRRNGQRESMFDFGGHVSRPIGANDDTRQSL